VRHLYDEIHVVYLSKHEALVSKKKKKEKVTQFGSAFDQFANLEKLSLAQHELFVCNLPVI